MSSPLSTGDSSSSDTTASVPSLPPNQKYLHGHHESVLRSHTWRTAQNSCAYLLPHLYRLSNTFSSNDLSASSSSSSNSTTPPTTTTTTSATTIPNLKILDIGCGPGTITNDLASLIAPAGGTIIGIDISEDILEQAREDARKKGLVNVTYLKGDVFHLVKRGKGKEGQQGKGEEEEGEELGLFEEGTTFDVVHVHQVLQHVQDPVGALKEIKRVTKPRPTFSKSKSGSNVDKTLAAPPSSLSPSLPSSSGAEEEERGGGGIIAIRESIYDRFIWYPESKGIEEWSRKYIQVAKSIGTEPNAGKMLHVWAREAGLLLQVEEEGEGKSGEGGRGKGRGRNNMICSVSNWCYSTEEEVKWWSGLWADRATKSNFAKIAIEKGLASVEELEGIRKAWLEFGESEDGWFVIPSGEILIWV